MTEELKPCPFCGSPAQIKRNKTVMVSCTHCTAATFQRLGDQESAAHNWNARPEEYRLRARIKELEAWFVALTGKDI